MTKNIKLRSGSSWMNLTPIYSSGFPNGVVSAPVGTTYIDTAVTNSVSSWIKRSGTGNTGWRALEGRQEWDYFNASTTVVQDGAVYKLTIPIPTVAGLFKVRILGRNSSGSVSGDLKVYTVNSGGTKAQWQRITQLVTNSSSSHEATGTVDDILSETINANAKYSIEFEHNRELGTTWGGGKYESITGTNYRTGRLQGNSGVNSTQLVVEGSTEGVMYGLQVFIHRLNINALGAA